MEKNIVLQAETYGEKKFELTRTLKLMAAKAVEPVRFLRDFYSAALERRVSMRQTWQLIEAQVAFFCGIIPADVSVAFRLLCLAWFLSAVMRYRKSLNNSKD